MVLASIQYMVVFLGHDPALLSTQRFVFAVGLATDLLETKFLQGFKLRNQQSVALQIFPDCGCGGRTAAIPRNPTW